ncbi:hypothetical protein CPB83DRAFT_851068 [Crepidotus variabilis]|uniref:Uncharacterized protein n=1 Tax=Crepidotus variabilis TaxID=179855 RepID=A0A9P6EI85_9AGAR|nr:hypothetical protein CPB83DRAFT_851068 [Crepidotus variabilis]
MSFIAIDLESAASVEPPRYFGQLIPVAPAHTGRYDVAKKVKRASASVPAGSRKRSTAPLPLNWTQWLHPEGKLYFFCDDGLRVVTDSYMLDASTAAKVDAWIYEIRLKAKSGGIILGEKVELFLQVTSDNDCNYYFVNLESRALFWLEDCSTSALGLLDVVSDTHLGLVLEAEYWAHIENFCMHLGGLPQNSIDDLILVFTHGLADTLTSTLSTFPYDATASEKILNLLNHSRDKISKGEVVTLVARFWGLIVYNRYLTHHGEEQARLSRDSSIIDADEAEEIQWTRTAFSMMSFGTFKPYMKKFDGLFVDSLVYGFEWESFMKSCISGWRDSIALSFGLLLLHVFCFFLPISSILASISGLTSSLSILVAILLLHRHEELGKSDASSAHEYLTSVKSSTFGFQGIAFAFSLPKALSILSFLALFSQWAFLGYNLVVSHPVALIAPLFVLMVLFAVIASTSTTLHFRVPSFRFWNASMKTEASMV